MNCFLLLDVLDLHGPTCVRKTPWTPGRISSEVTCDLTAGSRLSPDNSISDPSESPHSRYLISPQPLHLLTPFLGGDLDPISGCVRLCLVALETQHSMRYLSYTDSYPFHQ